MGKNRIVEEDDWVDYYGNPTTALYLDKKGLYTISEFIELLEAAREKFGDKKMFIHDLNTNSLGGFSSVYLNHGYDFRKEYGEDYFEDDTICIFG